ncbi:MAG: GNAT family N-acetyltransferase [Acidobacteriaceae bacterium]
MPTLVPITPALASLYKQVRLRALQDTPSAFGSTYDRERQLTDEDWHNRVTSLDGNHRIGFLALDAGQPCGLVLCFRDERDSPQAEILSMWVAPSHRRTGLSSALLDAVRHWAASHRTTTLRLMVVNNNAAAIAFYQRYGFTMTGRASPYPNNPTLSEFEMARPTTD